jgi:hypothetical protein
VVIVGGDVVILLDDSGGNDDNDVYCGFLFLLVLEMLSLFTLVGYCV